MDTATGYAWHAGELALQRSIGVTDPLGHPARKVIRDQMPQQHREFFAQLPFVVIGSVDPQGDAWATIRAGRPGFIASDDPSSLAVDLPRDDSDPAEAGMEDGDGLGMLGIEPATRRRNRVNGQVARRGGTAGFELAVRQSFGNCPRYITPRETVFTRPPGSPPPNAPIVSQALDARGIGIVRGADHFFVATYIDAAQAPDGHRQVDVSHRGGHPGFVRVGADGVLTVPDYAGNRFFNTLGNLLLNPRAGLVFVSPETGDLLQMTGDTEVLQGTPEAGFDGAERLWRFTPRQVVRRPAALPFRLAAPELTA